MIEDEWLKLRFKAGSIDALQRIYEKYRDRLLTLAMALLNDPHAAEDVLHDVFLTFAQSRDRFAVRGRLRSYLATCVVNRARDKIRARRHGGRCLDEEMPIECDAAPPDGRILSDEQSRLVARALARLPEDQRETLALHLNSALRLHEIAKLQNVPLTTVRGRYRHGIERLRSLLNGRL
jgi:RNA polymerase sigma-70 factor, ECF subfamily